MGPLIPLIGTGLSALFSFLGGKKAADAQMNATQAQQPYMNALTQIANRQMQQGQEADPVRRALIQMAFQRMPVASRAGIQAPSFGRPATTPGQGAPGARPRTLTRRGEEF